MSVISLEAGTGDSRDNTSNTYFISDLHLNPAQQDTIDLSLRFFEHVKGSQALFIIGDLFEYWLGDDGATAKSGTAVHLMHGNRDFLLGEQFADRVGASLPRDDHLEVDFGVARFSLLHGDTLCTDDVAYLQLRDMVRDAQWQSNFLALSIDQRIAQAHALREKSREAVANKSQGIMDVNRNAVLAHFAQFPSNTLIHGHTHRPFDHVAPMSTCSASTDESSAVQRRVVTIRIAIHNRCRLRGAFSH